MDFIRILCDESNIFDRLLISPQYRDRTSQRGLTFRWILLNGNKMLSELSSLSMQIYLPAEMRGCLKCRICMHRCERGPAKQTSPGTRYDLRRPRRLQLYTSTGLIVYRFEQREEAGGGVRERCYFAAMPCWLYSPRGASQVSRGVRAVRGKNSNESPPRVA